MSNPQVKDWLRRLESEQPEGRTKVWREILEEARSGKLSITKDQLIQLSLLCMHEELAGIRENAERVMHVVLANGATKPKLRRKSTWLSEWLWAPYQRSSSLVFFPFDSEFVRRDVQATVELARHVSSDGYPNTSFEEVPLDNVNWGEIFKNRRNIGALFIVGRLGMYGQEAIRRWGNPNARLTFGEDIRPHGKAKGSIIEGYHSVQHRDQNGDVIKQFDAEEENGSLIDYGLVQRYTVDFDARRIPVTICQGCKELGTLAAVQFAVSLQKSTIRLPKPGNQNSCFEALVRVSADAQDQRTGWRPGPKDLLLLFMDQYEYVQSDSDGKQDNRWLPQAPYKITIIRDERKKPVSIRLDNYQHGEHLKPKNEVFLMIAALCELSSRRPGLAVSLSELAQRTDIWSEIVETTHVKRRYNQLRNRNLGRAVEITGDGVLLRAKVEYQDVAIQPAKQPSKKRRPPVKG